MNKIGMFVLGLMLWSGSAFTAQAQPANPPDAELVQMTQEADIIVKARISEVEETAEGITFRLSFASPSAEGVLKGREWLTHRFLAPAGRVNPFEPNKLAIVFGKYDPVRKVNIVLEGTKARREPTEENMTRIEEVLEQQPRARMSMQTAKPAYRMGETVELQWKVKDTSPQPFRLYTGQHAIGSGVFINGRGSGPGVNKNGERKEGDYTPLAPGQEWTQTRPLDRDFFEGEALVRTELRNTNNYLGTNEKNVHARLDDVLLIIEETEFNLTFLPPDEADLARLTKQLVSPFWDEQWNALDILARTEKGRALPEVRKLMQHPKRKIRLRAAHALAWNSPVFDAALRELLFDPDSDIRAQTIEIMRDRRMQGAGLSLLALKLVQEKAMQDGLIFIGEDGGDAREKVLARYNFNLPITQQRTDDPRVGDILATMLKEGRDNGYVLMFLVDLQSKLRLQSNGETNAEQKQALLDAW